MHRSGDEALSILTVIILDYAPGRRYHLGEWTDKKVAMRIIFNQRVICFPQPPPGAKFVYVFQSVP